MFARMYVWFYVCNYVCMYVCIYVCIRESVNIYLSIFAPFLYGAIIYDALEDDVCTHKRHTHTIKPLMCILFHYFIFIPLSFLILSL